MKLSTYILTKNSEQYIEEILTQLSKCADEIVVLDSGSTDTTLDIVGRFPLAKVYYRLFDNFKDQRNYATSLCQYDSVLYIDSDEIPNETLVNTLNTMKKELTDLGTCGYGLTRYWYVMGRPVHSIYPIESPDHDIRLFDRRHVSFGTQSNLVHETLEGYTETRLLDGALTHHTFHTRQELRDKAEQYSGLAAQDLIRRKRKISKIKIILNPIAAYIKWYFFKCGFLDGRVGFLTGAYAYRYTKLKYRKAIQMIKEKP